MLKDKLTHWGRDKMAAIFQTIFSNAFSWMKMHELWLRFHWSLFLRVKLTIFQHWFRKWLSACQATNYYLNHWWLVSWRIYICFTQPQLFKKRNFNNPHPFSIEVRRARGTARQREPKRLTPKHQAYGPRTGLTRLYIYGLIELFAGLLMDPVRASHGPRTGIPMFFISYGTRAGPARAPYGTLPDT